MAAGDFTATQRARVLRTLNEVMPNINEDYNNIAIAQEILNRMTANVQAITVADRCIGGKLTYQIDCTDSVDDCSNVDTSGCDWTAPEHESASVNIDVDDCISEPFTITEAECNNNTLNYIDKYSYRLATALAKMEEKLAQKGGAFVDANARTPVADTEYGTIPVAPDNDQINFAAADWDLELISKMIYDARQNDITRPFGISTGLLWVESNLNDRKGAGCCTLDSANGDVTIAYDQNFGQLKQIVGEDALYLIDPDYVAFWTYNFERSDQFVSKGHSDLSAKRIKLPRLTYGKGRAPIYADLYKKSICGDGLSDVTDKYILKLPFGFFNAPDICSTGNTGILKFGVS